MYQIQNVQIKAQILAFYQMNAFVKVGQSQKYFRFELEYKLPCCELSAKYSVPQADFLIIQACMTANTRYRLLQFQLILKETIQVTFHYKL